MNYLIYINGMGPNYKGDNIYEFIFSDFEELIEICASMHNLYTRIKFRNHFVVTRITAHDKITHINT